MVCSLSGHSLLDFHQKAYSSLWPQFKSPSPCEMFLRPPLRVTALSWAALLLPLFQRLPPWLASLATIMSASPSCCELRKGKNPVCSLPGPYRVSQSTKLKQWVRGPSLEADRPDFWSRLCPLLGMSLEEDIYSLLSSII